MLLASRLEVRRVFWVAAVPSLIASLAALAVKQSKAATLDGPQTDMAEKVKNDMAGSG
jgi:hypothetical protein